STGPTWASMLASGVALLASGAPAKAAEVTATNAKVETTRVFIALLSFKDINAHKPRTSTASWFCGRPNSRTQEHNRFISSINLFLVNKPLLPNVALQV